MSLCPPALKVLHSQSNCSPRFNPLTTTRLGTKPAMLLLLLLPLKAGLQKLQLWWDSCLQTSLPGWWRGGQSWRWWQWGLCLEQLDHLARWQKAKKTNKAGSKCKKAKKVRSGWAFASCCFPWHYCSGGVWNKPSWSPVHVCSLTETSSHGL